jgi:membrane-associated HD superfamily phosphohydrolase
MDSINWLAVIAAALANFLIGGLWYSPLLFQKAWMRANGFTDDDVGKGNPAVIFGVSGLFSLIMAANLAAFVSFEGVTLGFAVGAALAAGLGWAALGLGIVALFERRSWSYILINGGYLTVAFLAMGLILGLWR